MYSYMHICIPRCTCAVVRLKSVPGVKSSVCFHRAANCQIRTDAQSYGCSCKGLELYVEAFLGCDRKLLAFQERVGTLLCVEFLGH